MENRVDLLHDAPPSLFVQEVSNKKKQPAESYQKKLEVAIEEENRGETYTLVSPSYIICAVSH